MAHLLPPVADEAHRTAFLRDVRLTYECADPDCTQNSIRGVADILGVSYSTARRYIQLSGARLRRRGPASKEQ